MVASATVWLKNSVGCTAQPTATAAAADARAAKGKGIARDGERETQRSKIRYSLIETDMLKFIFF